VIPHARLWFDEEGTPQIDRAQFQAFKERERLGKNRICRGGEIQVAIRDHKFFRHYFHFMETFVTLFAVQREMAPAARVTKIFLGNLAWDNPSQANVQRHMIKAVYPSAEISTEVPGQEIQIDSLIYIDRHSTHTSINKMLDPSLFLVCKWAPALRDLIYQKYNITLRTPDSARDSGRPPKILYVPRHPPRCLSESAEKQLLEVLARSGEVNCAYFAELPWQDQVRLTASHDVLVGVHGNGLTNLLWLPPHGTAIELFNENVAQYDYQLMAEVMGLDYFGVGGDRIHRGFSRDRRVGGNSSLPVNTLSLDNIEFILNAISVRSGLDFGHSL
jgi:hypothetical protein